MSQKIKFTYYVNRYAMDLSFLFEDQEGDPDADVILLIDLLRKLEQEKSQKKQDELTDQILSLLQLSLYVEFDPGKIFSTDWIEVPVNSKNSSLAINLDNDGLGYRISGDIWFDLVAKRRLSEKMMEAWEEATGGMSLPAFSGGIGEYACDSGSQFSWEILED